MVVHDSLVDLVHVQGRRHFGFDDPSVIRVFMVLGTRLQDALDRDGHALKAVKSYLMLLVERGGPDSGLRVDFVQRYHQVLLSVLLLELALIRLGFANAV